MPEAAARAIADTASAAVGETHTTILAATHVMGEAVAEFATPP
jgi:hypothetical protein